VLFDVGRKMKTSSQIVAGGGWRGTRLDRVKVKACIALVMAMILGVVSVSSIGTILFYAFIPAVVSLTVATILFVREVPIEFESLTGRVGTDPRKLYSRSGCRETKRNEENANKP
jgi:hypothetical protein